MTTKTASQLTPGDIIQSEQGPSRVTGATPDGNHTNLDLVTVGDGTQWGDSYPSRTHLRTRVAMGSGYMPGGKKGMGNGHRRRQVVRRVRAEETTCALCDQPVDKTLNYLPNQHGRRCPTRDCTGCIPDPMRGEVDEDIPRSRGGSAYDRANTHLMHRKCNQWKSSMTLREARTKFHGTIDGEALTVKASSIW